MANITRKPVQPDYGRRLLSSIIDERAQTGHKRPYASIPVSDDIDDGYRNITYRRFANAINRCALWLRGLIGTSQNFETLVYIGPADLRYQIICMAAVKIGYVVSMPQLPKPGCTKIHSPDVLRFTSQQYGRLHVFNETKQRLPR